MSKRLTLRLLAMGLIVGACVAEPQSVRAQGSGLFNSSGLTKSGTGGISGGLTGSGLGSMGTSGRSGSSGALGSSGFGGAGGGSNPFAGTGLAGMTGGGMGGSGMGGSGMTGMTNPFGTSGTNSGMVGRNSGAFAGNSQAGQAGGGNAGGANRNFGRGNNTSQRGSEFSQNQKSERTTSMVRPRQKVAFDYQLKQPTAVATKITTRLGKIGLKNPTLKNVEVKVDGDILVLTGKVETAEQSRLAAILVRQEPGVKAVRNDLQVEKPTTTETVTE